VRTVKKTAAPKTSEKSEQKKPESVPEIAEEAPDNVVPISKSTNEPQAVVEDPASVFKLCMLESDLEKVQLKMQLTANKAAEQIQQIIAARDKQIASLNGQFQKLRERHIQFREYIEQKHGINVKHYLYDDEIGVFRLNAAVKAQEETQSGEVKKENTDG